MSRQQIKQYASIATKTFRRIKDEPVEVYLKRNIYARIFYSPDGCWYWTGTVNHNGYGYVYVKSIATKNLLVHRLNYMLTKGSIPDGMLVCHHCDNRLCLNPDHLFLGTHKDNTHDMMRKGRARFIPKKTSKLNVPFQWKYTIHQFDLDNKFIRMYRG